MACHGHFSPPLNDHGRRPAAGAANGRAARLGILGVRNLGEKMMTCRNYPIIFTEFPEMVWCFL